MTRMLLELLAAVCAAHPGPNNATAVLFESFKAEHGVLYATAEEEAFRLGAFEKTLVRIARRRRRESLDSVSPPTLEHVAHLRSMLCRICSS